MYHYNISPEELYEATRKHWNVSYERVSNIRIICAVYAGIIREVYTPLAWHDSPVEYEGRSYFDGQVAPDGVRAKYINKSVAKYWKKGSQNPIKYVSSDPS